MSETNAVTTNVVVHNTGQATRRVGEHRFHPRERTAASLSDEELEEVRATPGLEIFGEKASDAARILRRVGDRRGLIARAKELEIPAKGSNEDLAAAIAAAEKEQ